MSVAQIVTPPDQFIVVTAAGRVVGRYETPTEAAWNARRVVECGDTVVAYYYEMRGMVKAETVTTVTVVDYEFSR